MAEFVQVFVWRMYLRTLMWLVWGLASAKKFMSCFKNASAKRLRFMGGSVKLKKQSSVENSRAEQRAVS